MVKVSSMNPKLTFADRFFRLLAILSIVCLGLLLYDLFWLGRDPYIPSIAPFVLRIVMGVIAGVSGNLDQYAHPVESTREPSRAIASPLDDRLHGLAI
jgi:hypothetical protein